MTSGSYYPCDSQESAASVCIFLANLLRVTCMIVYRHLFQQKQFLARAGLGLDLSPFWPLLQSLIRSRSQATVCSPLAECIWHIKGACKQYLEPDAELVQLGVATCQQLLQACELGLLSSCAAWLLHTHSSNDTLGHSLCFFVTTAMHADAMTWHC